MSRWACPSTTETPLTSTLDSGNCTARTGTQRSTGSLSSTRYKQFQLATELGGLMDTSKPSPPMYWSSHDRRIPRLGDRTKPPSWENKALSKIQRRNSWSSSFDTARLSSTSSIFMASSHRPKFSTENMTWHSWWRRRSVLVATAIWQVQQDNSGAKYHGKCSSRICWPNSRLGTLAPHNEHPTEGVTREALTPTVAACQPLNLYTPLSEPARLPPKTTFPAPPAPPLPWTVSNGYGPHSLTHQNNSWILLQQALPYMACALSPPENTLDERVLSLPILLIRHLQKKSNVSVISESQPLICTW